MLNGQLANGAALFVLDASLEYWSDSQGFVSGSGAIVGRGSGLFGIPAAFDRGGSVPVIESADFQIGALDALLGAAPIAQVQNPGLHPDNPKDVWSATLNSDRDATWSRDEVELTVDFRGSMRAADAFEYRLSFSPFGRFTYQNGATLREVVDTFVEPLRRIASISTGTPQDLTYLSVRLKDRQGTFQVFGSGITQEPFKSSSERVRESKSAVRAKSDDLSLLSMVDAWRHLAATHHPLIETYGAMLHARDQHPRSRFLLLIQALEGMHGFETASEFAERRARHVAQREEVLIRVDYLIGTRLKKFLKGAIGKSPPTSLETALKRMISGLPVDLMGRLDGAGLVADAKTDPQAPNSTVSALRVVRNNLAHGKRGYEASQLHEVVELLELVVRAHSLKLLGCSDEVLTRVLQ